jgi:hypothetical protein
LFRRRHSSITAELTVPVEPPSTGTITPVTHAAAGEAR